MVARLEPRQEPGDGDAVDPRGDEVLPGEDAEAAGNRACRAGVDRSDPGVRVRLRTNTACMVPGSRTSSVYIPRPVRKRGSSLRRTRPPRSASAGAWVVAMVVLLYSTEIAAPVGVDRMPPGTASGGMISSRGSADGIVPSRP
jgi:hypothetical protein